MHQQGKGAVSGGGGSPALCERGQTRPVTTAEAGCLTPLWAHRKPLAARWNMIVLIDNYDSFTFNLFHYLAGLEADVAVHRNDKISVGEVMALEPEAIVLSPGPCTPNEAGICLDLIAKASPTIPMLGVCLGHQAMGQAFGGKVIRAPQMMHGKLSEIRHDATGVFRGINGSFQATRYHSLIVERSSLPAGLRVNADTADGIIMGMAHET